MKTIRVGLVQMNALLGKLEENLAVHARYIRMAARRGVELVCFPELSLSGHWVSGGRWRLAQEVPGGSAVKALEGLCREYGVVVSAGLAERAGAAVYNTQVIVGPDGYLGKQRKLHPSRDEYFYYRGGCELNIIELDKATIGIVLCFDNMFPEVQRCLAIKGVEVVLMPHAVRCGRRWPLGVQVKREVMAEKRRLVETVYASRCYDNGQYGLYCDQVGQAGEGVVHGGGLAVIGPDGEIVKQRKSVSEGMLVTDLPGKAVADRREGVCFNLLVRRPECYQVLTALKAD